MLFAVSSEHRPYETGSHQQAHTTHTAGALKAAIVLNILLVWKTFDMLSNERHVTLWNFVKMPLEKFAGKVCVVVRQRY